MHRLGRSDRAASRGTGGKILARGLRLLKRLIWPLWERSYGPCARVARVLHGRACFVGITGSYGKTSTKQLVAAVLSADGRVHLSGVIAGRHGDLERTLVTMGPWHRYCVEELSGYEPGSLARLTSVLRPDIGVVTKVGYDHHKNFRSLEETAEEKATLVEVLPPHGVAVLNADDPLVWAMRARTKARVIGCGFSEEAELRAEDVSSAWPERCSFTAVHGDQRVRVQTRMIGAHWAFAALAALGVGLARGIPLETGARMLAKAEPMYGRMSCHETKDGVTFILDSYKSSYDTVAATLAFLTAARARRKIFVLGHMSDYKGSASSKYRDVARKALAGADEVLFVTPHNSSVRKLTEADGRDRLKTFATVYELNSYLQSRLQAGDLVVLKGSERPDHLKRLCLDRDQAIRCWRERCGRNKFCPNCELWSSPLTPVAT